MSTIQYDSGVIQIKSSIDNWGGREAICRISDTATDETVYIRQETVKDNTFKYIKTGDLNGTYNVNIGIADNGTVISEKAYTAQNITPDNAETSAHLYNWDFASDITASSGNDVPAVSGNAVYSAENKAIQMTSDNKSGGKMAVVLSDSVKAQQGTKTIITSNIVYGKLDKKYMDYGGNKDRG